MNDEAAIGGESPLDPTAAGNAEAPMPRSGVEWFELLYHELRRIARGELFRYQTLTIGPSTVLHEAWLRIGERSLEFASQAELVGYASRVMRSIVIDHLREQNAQKRGRDFDRVTYETLADLRQLGDADTLRLSDALDDLSRADPLLAELVELKFFSGLTLVEIAALRGVSERTAQRDWDKARMLLFDLMTP
jgi:RNA polymerase sigma factor (TIGR02999 family)